MADKVLYEFTHRRNQFHNNKNLIFRMKSLLITQMCHRFPFVHSPMRTGHNKYNAHRASAIGEASDLRLGKLNECQCQRVMVSQYTATNRSHCNHLPLLLFQWANNEKWTRQVKPKDRVTSELMEGYFCLCTCINFV